MLGCSSQKYDINLIKVSFLNICTELCLEDTLFVPLFLWSHVFGSVVLTHVVYT